MELYLEDSYKREIETTVKDVQENFVVLEDTIFYPSSGGQLNDLGKIFFNNQEYNVINVIKKDNIIFHELDKQELKKGDLVKGVIDWNRRYQMMKSHTAAHILSSVFNKRAGALITGNQLGLDKIRIDFSLENFDKEKIINYLEEANNLIKTNQEISCFNLSRKEVESKPELIKLAKGLLEGIEVIRILKIGDIDEQPDGGTHVKNTSEIGELEFIRCDNKGKNNRRVYFKLKE